MQELFVDQVNNLIKKEVDEPIQYKNFVQQILKKKKNICGTKSFIPTLFCAWTNSVIERQNSLPQILILRWHKRSHRTSKQVGRKLKTPFMKLIL